MNGRFLRYRLILICVLILSHGSMASAKLLPGAPIVAVARGRIDSEHSWSTTVHACIGQTIELSAVGSRWPIDCKSWSHDWDYNDDPHRVCDVVTFTWKWVKGSAHGDLPSGGSIPASFDELGTYTCTVTVSDNDGNHNDADQTADVTVIVGEITSLTGPDQCVLCRGKPYTFTVQACCCDSVDWIASTGYPASQEGGCSFTTQFNYRGDGQTVTATCGSDSHTTRPYYVAEPCEPVQTNVDCLAPIEDYASLPDPPGGGCVFSLTNSDTTDFYGTWSACLDCASDHWKVRFEDLEYQVHIAYDTKGLYDPAGTYTCEAATCALEWYNFVQSGRQGNLCDTTCVPLECLQVHERAHYADYCDAFYTEAAKALEEIDLLYREPQEPYCNEPSAYNSFAVQVSNIAALQMQIRIKLAVEAIGETNADNAMIPCLSNLVSDICAHLQDPCSACP